MATSQTLDRGLRALAFVAGADAPPTIDDVAGQLGVHRSIAYRIVRTLEDHRLIARDGAGGCWPASGLAELARHVRTGLGDVAIEVLPSLADRVGHTAFLVVRDGDEAVTVESFEPVDTLVGVTYRPGTRHPVDRGAPGLAILAGSSPVDDERPEVTAARRRGWATSSGEVVPGMSSVAVPVSGHDAAIAVVYLAAGDHDAASIAPCVCDAARTIERRLDTSTTSAGRADTLLDSKGER